MFLLHIRNHRITQLWSKSEMVDLVCERVRLILEVVLQVMHMQIAVRERLSRRNVEVSNDLVDANAAFEPTPFFTLLVKMLGVMLAFALLNALTATEGPGDRGVSVAHLVASVAAAGLDCVGGGGGTETFTAIVGVEVGGFVFVAGKCQSIVAV